MRSYSKLRDKDEVIYSDILTVNTLQWRLKIYPNGNGGIAKGTYLSIFLEMVKVSS